MAKRKSSGCALKEQLWFGANLRPPSVECFWLCRLLPSHHAGNSESADADKDFLVW